MSRAIFGLIALLAVLATLYMTLASGSGGGGASSGTPRAPVYGNAINGAQNAVQQANADAQRAAGTTTP